MIEPVPATDPVGVEVDPQIAADLETVSTVVKRATREGLLVEVISTFGDCRAAGDSVLDAVSEALRSWDV